MDIASCTSEDYLSSAESVTSGITSYEDELSEIRSILSSTCRNNNNYSNTNIDYESRIAALKNELKNVRLIYESYKVETSTKSKKHELEAHEKFEKLFNHTILLESQLVNANTCINTTKNEVSVENYELKTEILRLKNEVNVLRNKLENVNRYERDLKLCVEESNQSLEIRNKVIEDLKIKISELYVELQDLKRNEWRNHTHLLGSKNESNRQLKNLQWYKERLVVCQNEKVEACKEIIKLKSLMSTKSLEIIKLSNEKDDWMFKFRDAKHELEKSKLEILHETNLEIDNIRAAYEDKIANLEFCNKNNKYKRENVDNLIITTDFITVLCQICDNFLKGGVLKNLFRENLSININFDVLDELFSKINKKYNDYDIKTGLLSRLKLLDERCLQIKQKNEFFDSFLKNNFKNVVEEYRIFSKVKDLETEEIIKRYERNVRTLLRKTKEQLKERINVEKQLNHLQAVNNLNVENIDDLTEKLEEKLLESNQLNEEVDRKNCTIDNLNKVINDNENKVYKQLTNETDDLSFKQKSLNLKMENEKLKIKFDYLKNIEEKLVAAKTKQEDTNKCLQAQQILSDNMNKDLSKLKEEHLNCATTINNLESNSNELEERNNFYINELEILRSSLKQKQDESLSLNYQNEEIKMEKSHFEKLLTQKELEIHRLYEELRFANQDKYFYQRLSNDLKISLNTSVKQNEILKEQLYNRSVDAGYHSLSDVTQGPPSVFNENCINDLLLRFNVLNKNKPVKQLKDGMSGLKMQMSLLKHELVSKNFITSN